MAYTDRFPIVKNFLETKLTADCDAGETTLYLENVDGLPRILAGRDYVPLVLRDAGTVREIVYVDAVDNTAGTVTVRRGQEGTTPAAWATGTYAYCTVTSDSFQRMRVNGFAPLATDEGRPSISRTSATTVSITGDFSAQLEVGMAVRVLSGDTVVEPTDAELGAIHITSVSFSAGVTAVSFQNVSLPNKVDGLDLGLSVASAPLYHPDTVVADEDTLTQVQNVLSVSQKFKDDLKAEQALVDAAQDAAIAEAQTRASNALPLSGGSMTSDYAMNRTVNNGYIYIGGGTGNANNSNSGGLLVYGKDHAYSPGYAVLEANDGTARSKVSLSPAGSFRINDVDVLTSAGGNITSPLKSAAGTYAITSQVSTSLVRILGGSIPSNGANLDLYGGDSESSGKFVLRARNSSGYKGLEGKIDGPLTWGGDRLVTMPNYSAGIQLLLDASGYTAPSDGYIMGESNMSGSGTRWFFVNGSKVGRESDEGGSISFPVSKGDVITIESSTADNVWFYPIKGA